jgi:hypothetical protein
VATVIPWGLSTDHRSDDSDIPKDEFWERYAHHIRLCDLHHPSMNPCYGAWQCSRSFVFKGIDDSFNPQAFSQRLDLFHNSCFPFLASKTCWHPTFSLSSIPSSRASTPNNVDALSLCHLKTKMSQSTTANDCKPPSFLDLEHND